MNNQFDERLISRISDVFDNYEDNSANEGWKELRKKFPVKQQRSPLIYWIGSAAAILILAIGFWIGLPSNQQEDTTIAKVLLPKERSGLPESPISGAEVGTSLENNSPQNSPGSLALKPRKKSRLALASIPKETQAAVLETAKHEESTATSQSLVQLVAADSSISSPLKSREPKRVVADPVLLANNPEPETKKKTLLDLASEENITTKDTRSSRKKVTFGVYAGSFVNYAEGSDNKVNLGAGFSSDIALSKRLKLSTGLAISQNTLSFNGSNDIPEIAQATFSIKIADAVDPSRFIPVSYNLNKYNASLLGIDIPLNLKYSLSENKRDMFVSAGVSSGAFINESYTYYYMRQNMVGSEPAVEDANKVQKDFGNFDIARMLNLSFGVGYPIGKQKLIIEPFVKYPLKGTGVEHLRFGAGGVNLKLNFETNKK